MVPVQGIQNHHHLFYDLGFEKKAQNSCSGEGYDSCSGEGYDSCSGEGYDHTNILMAASE